MPIYEIDMSYEEMVKAVQIHHCAQCGKPLEIAWSADHNSYMLRCEDISHNLITRTRKLSAGEIESRKVFRGGTVYMETTALQKLDPGQMLERVNQARFPKDLTIVDRQLIAKISIEYGLDPLFGELMIYQGRPYITIDARRRKAQETGNLDGIGARPATKEERKARGTPEGDYLFIAEVWVKGASHPFEGVGRVFEAETKGDTHLPVVKDPAAQAEKRAEAQALRRAFHIPLPSFEEIIEGQFKELPPENHAPQSKTKITLDKNKATAPPPIGTVTGAQIGKIWKDAGSMGYSADDVHNIIKAKWGVDSVKSLSVAQASTLIDIIARGEGLPAPKSEYLGLEQPLHENPDDSN